MLSNNIDTSEIVAGIYNTLVDDLELVGKLAESKPVTNPKGANDRRNSIVPMSRIRNKDATRPVPLIGIRSGVMTRAGTHSFDVFVFIRCYTGLDKAFVENNEIMSLVNKLLDNQFIELETASTAEMVLEQMSGEEYDEGYKLNYREGQYRLTVI